MVASVEDGLVHKPHSSDSDDEVVIKMKHTHKKLIDSESDDDDVTLRSSVEQQVEQCGDYGEDAITLPAKKKQRIFFRSDSEPDDDDEEEEDTVNLTESTEGSGKSASKLLGDSKCLCPSPQKSVNLTWYKDSSLYDAEGSDDELPESSRKNVPCNEADFQEPESTAQDIKTKQKPKSRRKSAKKPSTTNKTEVQKIYSESQRMVRETRLSLPYHKPRQRTLAEFLQRRRSLPPMPKSLKVSSEQMKEICKQLEEREKEVKEFFKSESEDSDADKTSGDEVDTGVQDNNNEFSTCSGNMQEGKNKVIADGENDKTIGEGATVGNEEGATVGNEEGATVGNEEGATVGNEEGTTRSNEEVTTTSNEVGISFSCDGTTVVNKETKVGSEKGNAVFSEKSGLTERAKELSVTNEKHNIEKVGRSSELNNDSSILETETVSGSTHIQDVRKSYTDETSALQHMTLKLFGSGAGSSNTDVRVNSAMDSQAAKMKNFLIEETTSGILNDSTFEPNMSECSQIAMDCVYGEATADGFRFKEPTQLPIVETISGTDLDSQGLVLCVSESFDKDEESCEPVTSQKNNQNNSIITVEESKDGVDAAIGSKGKDHNHDSGKISNNFANAFNQSIDNVFIPKECDLDAAKDVVKVAAQTFSANTDFETCGIFKIANVHVGSDEENSQITRKPYSPGSKVDVISSKSLCGAASDSDKREPSSEILQELNPKYHDVSDGKSVSVLKNVSNFQPRLQGDSTGVIDLEVVPKPAGVRKLIERFLKHSSTKKKPQQKKHIVELGVVSAEKGTDGVESVKKDIISITLGKDECTLEDPELFRPGAKFRRLKEELQQQIARQREEEWTKRAQAGMADQETPVDDKGGCSPFENELDEEEKEEFTETDSEDDEEEDEALDHVKISEKKRIKSAFVDDEAELSDDGNAADVSSDEDEDDDGDTTENEIDDNEQKAITAETLLKTQESDFCISSGTETKTRFHRLKTFDTFGSDGDSSDDARIDDTCPIPAYQPEGGMKCGGGAPLSEEKSSQHHFLSPIFSLPVRTNRTSSVKSGLATPGTPNSHQTISSAENTPLSGDGRGQSRLYLTQKKLFAEVELAGTQENMEELMGLCSGKFEGVSENEIKKLVNTSSVSLTDQDSELLGLCSGKFESQAVPLASFEGKDEWKDTTESFQLPADSQDVHLTLSEDVLSLVKPDRQKEETTPQPTLNLASSDEEDSLLKESLVKKKLKHSHKKLTFSDDENEQVSTQVSTASLSESDDQDEEDGVQSSRTEMVAYDSEENEIVFQAGEDKVKSMAEFFENEAELSESEWGSADEDEQGLDNMDSEDGDEEQLDSKKVKEQLDRIHMRRLMDDDNREVRLLKELLFEDGELHSEGGGRQRRFKWKNIDNFDENYQPPHPSDEDVYDVDDENEEEWRRMRHKREMFLLEQQAKGDVAADNTTPDVDDSKLMKLGMAALKRIRSTNSQDLVQEKQQETIRSVSDPCVSPDPKRQFQLLVKRGSFLARGETALARLAQLTRGAADQNINGPKNSRKFVFATISPEKEVNNKKETNQVKVQKRRSVEVTPPVLKKLRLSEEIAKGRCLLDHLVP